MRITTRILQWFYKLSWKKVMGLSLFLLIVAVVPISLQLTANPTRTRSEAALINPSPQAVTAQFETPQGLPEIYLVDHFFGKIGDAVLIHGKNLGGLHENSWISLAGRKIKTENLVSWTGSYIEFILPPDARSGQVEISILGHRTIWPGMFFVVDENTATELKLEDNQLWAKDLTNGKELLVWLLILKGEGELKVTPLNGVKMEQKVVDLPLGKVREVVVSLQNKEISQSQVGWVELARIDKNQEILVGIARGELSTATDSLIPLKVNPLYVIF